MADVDNDSLKLNVDQSVTRIADLLVTSNHANLDGTPRQRSPSFGGRDNRAMAIDSQQVCLEMTPASANATAARDGREDKAKDKDHEALRDKSRPAPLNLHTSRVSSQISMAASEADSTSPSALVHFILGEERGGGKPLFCQMSEFREGEWLEAARWVKYEEDVEHGGERWSKPHVATLGLYSVMAMRSLMSNGVIALDLDADSLDQVADVITREWVKEGHLEEYQASQVKSILSGRRHVHLYDIQKNKKLAKRHSAKDLSSLSMSKETIDSMDNRTDETSVGGHSEKYNSHFLKKLQRGTEAANVLCAGLDSLRNMSAAFVRIAPTRAIKGITEVPINSRFLFILVGASADHPFMRQIGRAISTVLCDDVFKTVAYKSMNREDLLAGVDEFLSNVTLLPPGEWDPSIRLEPPSKVPSQDPRKEGSVMTLQAEEEEGEEEEINPCLRRTGRLFGGLIEDFKRRSPFFLSDFKDALHPQCVASFIFLFFACLTPTITFGGMLNTMLGGYMGAMESILAGALGGIIYGLFAGQPLTLLGSTGPVLVFEKIVYTLCKDNDFDYMSTRFWIGMWVMALCIIIVAFDLSSWVRFITRFTEESFAGLISIIFIVEAFSQLFEIAHQNPVNVHPEIPLTYECYCVPPYNKSEVVGGNVTKYFIPKDRMMPSHSGPSYDLEHSYRNAVDWFNITKEECKKYHGSLVGPGCSTPFYKADIFFFSCIIFIGTFAVSYGLKSLKTSRFGTTMMRSYLSDFAVIIAIALMSLFDCLVGLETPKLIVPQSVTPTRSDRGWIISPFTPKTPWWIPLVSALPAILCTILIFMDQQITAVIVNRKDNKLVKGAGYHLDLLVLALYIGLTSLLGIPWFVAATVPSVVHVMSLKKESETAAPGEKPQFLGCREQRVTQIMIGVFHGLSVLLTSLFMYIPMAVLYGVFLYMGVSSLGGLQVVQRCLLFLMPKKWQPDFHYLRHVPISRVHLFTLIQLVCFIALWVIKMIKSTSILFPIMLLVLCVVRKLMEYMFSETEIKYLDDLIPEETKREKEDKHLKMQHLHEEKKIGGSAASNNHSITNNNNNSSNNNNNNNGNNGEVTFSMNQLMYNPETETFNISKEMMSTQLWKFLVSQSVSQQDSQVHLKPDAAAGSNYLNQNMMVYRKKEK